MHGHDERETRKYYDSLGGRLYDIRYEKEQKAKYEKILSYMDIDSSKLVLDDGSGTGLLMKELRAQAVGVDISPKLVSWARRRLRKGKQANFILSDSAQLPLKSQIFDIVFAVTLLQNLKFLEDSLSEMKRVARKGSKIIVTALKKSFCVEDFRQLLKKSDLNIESLILDEDLKDWIAIASR